MRNSRILGQLPNALTLTSLGCGFSALVLALAGDGSARALSQAAALILVALVCDLLDGRAARWTGTAGPFGAALDSLADLVSFGIAPAALVWHWALQPLGPAGFAAAFAFAACGCVRLARFTADADASPGEWFSGMPITIGAGLLAALVLTHQLGLGVPPRSGSPAIPLLLVLGAAMVCTVPYRTFKAKGSHAVLVRLALVVLPLAALITATLGPAAALLGIFAALALSGPVEWLARAGRYAPSTERTAESG